MTSAKRHSKAAGAARRRGELHHADGDRRVGQTIKARAELATDRVGGRAWLNGRELGGTDPRYMRLALRTTKPELRMTAEEHRRYPARRHDRRRP